MADSVHHSILVAVRDEIRSIGLVGLDQDKIAVLSVPEEAASLLGDLPKVVIAPFGTESFDATGGTVAKDDIGYPVFVAVLAVANRENDNLEQWLEWREQIVDKLVRLKLTLATGVTSAFQTDVIFEPGPIVNQTAWFQQNRFQSEFALRVEVRKQRRA